MDGRKVLVTQGSALMVLFQTDPILFLLAIFNQTHLKGAK
ncbi:hypothetical protein HMF8227_00469 [Saliniradius amylolyticus]|uniref:Uncharacterized protein n=1 Tax=Saliniradius amylolyticus TaxID=2183582 RepID=A0A2S2DZY0_9ALTE|nr:hypothetical protein HMF8227_00469 [Saliniradius amylolyticus]